MLRRKIPLNYRNVTGVAHSTPDGTPTPFESTLERDFIEIVRFDTANVSSYQSQTPIIDYVCTQGRRRRYTPDLFVTYRDGRRVMYEVKPREVLWQNWPYLKPKFKHAIRYGADVGFKFKIVTEVEIRTEALANVRFLTQFRFGEGYHPHHKNILETLHTLEVSTPQQLINTLGTSLIMRAELLHTVWRLVADNLIAIDMSARISMDSSIWLALRGKS